MLDWFLITGLTESMVSILVYVGSAFGQHLCCYCQKLEEQLSTWLGFWWFLVVSGVNVQQPDDSLTRTFAFLF